MTTPRSALVVDVVALRRRTGSARSLSQTVELGDLGLSSAHVLDGRVDVDLEIENVVEGIVARGRVSCTWEGECRRCLEAVTGELSVALREIFESDPTDGETWPIAEDHIDLEPAVRESVLLALPLAPLCRDECVGPEPERFPTGGVAADDSAEVISGDPRWAALDELRFDE